MTSNTPMVRLGELIEECDLRNSDNALTLDAVRGISIEKKFIPTKANMEGVSLTPYKIVKQGWFCYVTVTSRNGERISLAEYNEPSPVLVSSSYIVFRSKDENVLLPEYLFLFFNRTEFDRYARFNSWGSARETLDFAEMCRMEIPLPDIETQRALVAVYNGLQQTIAENEALIRELESACHAFIVDCKTKYPKVRLGEWLEICEKRNSEGKKYQFTGVNKDKTFMPTVANTNELDNTKYKVVSKDMFVFSGMQTGRDVCIRLALYSENTPILISPAYTTFVIKNPTELFPAYFFLIFCRFEMDRYGAFLSDGSIRSNLDWDRFCEIEIPLPPIEFQHSIADVYNCLQESKRIVQESRELMKELCPALVQKAAHSA